MEQRFDGRTAVVSGGSRGIGAAIALGLAGEGAQLAITYRGDQHGAEQVAEQARGQGVQALAIQADARDRSAVAAMVARVTDELGPIGLLVNNGATQRRVPFLELTDEDWKTIMSVNLDGYFVVGQEVARAMVEAGRGGAILNVTSNAQDQVAPNMTAYSVSKAAGWKLTQQMAYELAAHDIRVNALAPGLTETDLNRADLADEEYRAARLSRIPLGLIAEPQDHVAAALYLLSDGARYATGSCVTVDGGNVMLGPSSTFPG